MPGGKSVLFLCSGNSARSQMAEGFIKSYVHPLAIRVMEEGGIDISEQISKSMDLFLNETFDYVITLCEHAARFCPSFPGQGKRVNWSFDDPAAAVGTIEERLVVFRRVRGEIRAKIEGFLKSEASESV
jgi:arsenate reductase